jgi:hypothetical protein
MISIKAVVLGSADQATYNWKKRLTAETRETINQSVWEICGMTVEKLRGLVNLGG